MTKLYSIDVKVIATAYIKAESPEEALEKLRGVSGDGMELEPDSCPTHDLAICGRQYDDMLEDEEVADVTLSPAMTFIGYHADEVSLDDFELVHEEDEGDA